MISGEALLVRERVLGVFRDAVWSWLAVSLECGDLASRERVLGLVDLLCASVERLRDGGV